MPVEVRWFIRTSLLCLVFSTIVGTAYFSWNPIFGKPPPHFVLPLHIHLGVVGWLVNLVMGVALWMFPMPPGPGGSGRPRYSETRTRIAFLGINGGLLLRFVSEPFQIASLEILSGILQTGGILICVAALWPRIRPMNLEKFSRKEGAESDTGQTGENQVEKFP